MSNIAEGWVRISARFTFDPSDCWLLPGNGVNGWFQDHAHGHEIVVVPAGGFTIGTRDGDGAKEAGVADT